MLTKSFLTIAEEIIETGYSIFPYEQPQIKTVQEMYRQFLARRLNEANLAAWRYTLPGEEEADLGLVTSRVHNNKTYFFHYNKILQDMLERSNVLQKQDEEFMSACTSLYNDLNNTHLEICREFDAVYNLHLTQAFDAVLRHPVPYSANTLQLLAQPYMLHGVRASGCIDRSCITIRLGNSGGDLHVLKGPNNQSGEIISPPPGHAVAHCGVKMLWASAGVIKPLLYKTTTMPGQIWEQIVHVGHFDIGDYKVKKASAALEEFGFISQWMCAQKNCL